MSEDTSESEYRTDVTDLRDTLREDSLPSTAKQSLSELALLLVELPEPTSGEASPVDRIPAVVEALAACEPSQMSVALPTASRPMATPQEAGVAASASVIVDFSVISELTLPPVVRAAEQGRVVRPPLPVASNAPRSAAAHHDRAPVPIDNSERGATTRQAIMPVPQGPPAIPSSPGQERAAWLVILAGSQHPCGHVVPLTFTRRTRYRIGGDPSCEVVINSPVVSREHAEIGFDATLNGFFLADLGSTNGTYVQPPGMNLYQVAGTAPLRDNSLIWLGREQVRFSFRCY